MDKVTEELKKGLKLLKVKWQEGLAQYKQKFLNSSLSDKKKEVISTDSERVEELKAILLGDEEPLFVENHSESKSHLNFSQNLVCKLISSAKV